MEEFVVPTLESIADESDRAALADVESKVREYGATLLEDPANVDTLRDLGAVIDAVQTRLSELTALDDAAAAKEAADAADLAAIKSKFAAKEVDPKPEVISERKEMRIPIQPKVELSVEDKIEDIKEEVKNLGSFRLSPIDPMVGHEVVTDSRILGEKLVDAWRQINRTKTPGTTRINLFRAEVSAPQAEWLGGENAEHNYTVVRDKVIPSAYAAADESVRESLVASGGYCAPLNVDYSIPRYSQICSTLEDFLPSVRAPRGGLKWMIPPSDTTASGVAVITCAEDAAGYVCESPAGTTACKPYATVTCPTQATTCVDFITYAIRFGNLNYMTFPELVDWAMHQLMVNVNRTVQTYLLNKINNSADVVAVTSATVQYGAMYDLLQDLLIVGARYRAQYKMCYNSGVLDLLLPRFTLDLIRLDLMARRNGADYVTLSEADVSAWFRALGYNVYFYEGAATGEYTGGDPVGAVTASATIAPLPNKVVAYIMMPGSWVILDNGVLDFGLVRDSTLNHANNLEIHAERFIGAARVGEKPIKLTSTVCANGSFSMGVAPIACTGSNGTLVS